MDSKSAKKASPVQTPPTSAIPPILGIGCLWTLRLLGESTKPLRIANARTPFVRMTVLTTLTRRPEANKAHWMMRLGVIAGFLTACIDKGKIKVG